MFDLKKLGSNADEFVELLAEGVGIIAKLTKSPLATEAVTVLAVINTIIDALQHAYEGKVTPDVIRAEWKKLQKGVADNDNAADAALKKKFDVTDEPADPNQG